MKTQFVGQGSYGCVLKPAKKCNIQLNIKNTVVKLFKEENEYNKELKNHNIIENIFKNNKNIIVNKLSNCKKNINEYDITAYSKCKDIDYNTDIYQIIYEYGGIDLDELTILKKTTFKKIFMHLDNIFFALIILKNKKFIHQDIRSPNILLNLKKKESKLIDFGFLINMKNFNDLDNKFISQTNHQYPPEINKNNFLAFFEYFKDIIVKHQSYFINNKKRKEKFKYILHYLYQEIGLYTKYYETNKNKNNLNKFDIYMVGTTLFNLFIISNITNKMGLNNYEYNLILSFIKKLINFNIEKRYSVEKAKKEYFKIKKILSKK